MPSRTVMASAPGSLMLFGEHAVLHGRQALVCAVNRRIRVALTPREDGSIVIESELGRLDCALTNIPDDERFRFLIALLRGNVSRVASGFTLRVASEFSHNIGFGSSAAVTVAANAAITQWLSGEVELDALFASSRDTIRSVQGLGSGADVAASVYGGLVLYRADPAEVEKLSGAHPLTAVYSGSKRPTPEVVRWVAEQRAQFPETFEKLFDAAENTARTAADAAEKQDWKTFGRMMNVAQGVMDAMGVNNARLSEIAYALREQPGILGSKISGSGLGDCVVGLGKAAAAFPFEAMAVEMDAQGVTVEKS